MSLLVVSQSGVSFETPTAAALNLAVFAVVSLVTAGSLAVVYRWYFRDKIPEGVAILVSVAAVALYINTASLGTAVSEGTIDLFRPSVVFFNIVALGVATVMAPIGLRVGDALSSSIFAVAGLSKLETDVGTVVRSAGRVTSLTLPEEIADMESYDPVTPETKAELAGKTLVFPRRLTVEQLRSRLIDRLKEDYAVGYVDVDLTEDATVEYLAVGSRAAGVGATLAPGTVAVAIRADPPNNAAAGDTVQVWQLGETPKRITTGELRGTAGDVVTIAVDENDAMKLSTNEQYRLVTMPAEQRVDRAFATLLRSVDETMGSVTVAENSALVGQTPRDVSATVIARRTADGAVTPLPDRDQRFVAGETIYVLGRPDMLRSLEASATSPATETTDGGTDSDSPEEESATSDATATSDDTESKDADNKQSKDTDNKQSKDTDNKQQS